MKAVSGTCWALALLAAAAAAFAQGGDPGYAQDRELLLEGCAALKVVPQQSACLEALARMEDVIAQVPPKTPEELAAAKKRYLKKKYAAVTTAFGTLKAATAKPTKLDDYLALVDAAFNEVTAIRPRAASDAERQAIQSFDLAIEEYRQAAKNWEAADKFGLPASSFVVPKWRLARDAVKQAESQLAEAAARSAR